MGNADIHRGADTNALIAPRVITGAINGPAFDTCIETQLAPALDPGTVVILDKLQALRPSSSLPHLLPLVFETCRVSPRPRAMVRHPDGSGTFSRLPSVLGAKQK